MFNTFWEALKKLIRNLRFWRVWATGEYQWFNEWSHPRRSVPTLVDTSVGPHMKFSYSVFMFSVLSATCLIHPPRCTGFGRGKNRWEAECEDRPISRTVNYPNVSLGHQGVRPNKLNASIRRKKLSKPILGEQQTQPSIMSCCYNNVKPYGIIHSVKSRIIVKLYSYEVVLHIP